MTWNEKSLESAVEQWKHELAEHRQSWPEWDELARRVERDEFSLVYENVSKRHYLLSSPDASGARLVHRLWQSDESPTWPAYLPGYLKSLLELRAVRDSAAHDEGGLISLRGGIADEVPGIRLANFRTDPVLCGRLEFLVGYSDPDTVPVPDDLYTFQQNRHEHTFCTDTAGQVHVFSPAGRAFESIGSLESFVRYCVRCALDGIDWFADAYQPNRNLQDYGLRHIPGAGGI